MQFYPQATQRQRRLNFSNPAHRSIRPKFFKLSGINFIILQVLFLCLLCYLFGALFRQKDYTHNLTVVFVDYDGGVIGTAVRGAYQQLRGSGFPTLIERSPLQYSQPSALESAVCNIDYWAALYVAPNASNRLARSLTGGAVSSSYNRSDVLTYIWNEARYPTIVDSISVELETLSEAARIVYSSINGTGAVQTLPAADTAAVSVFSNPWKLVSVNIQPTTQGSRLVYNTLVIILVLLQEFFFLAMINGLYAQFKIYGRISPRRIMAVRLILSVLFTFVGSLCTAGAIWAFRSGWDVNSNQFVLTWMSLWLFAHLNFLTLDVFSIWLPPPILPMALITWVVINITSILAPFALVPAFYRWAYALPTHAVYNVLVDIWSGGCNPTLDYALPVMFAYELSSLSLSLLGVYRRSHFGFIALENEEKAFQEKIATALAEAQKEAEEGEGLEMQRTEGRARGTGTTAIGEELSHAESAGPVQRVGTIATPEAYEEMAGHIWRETTQLRQEQARADKNSNLGPSFDVPFGD